MATKRRELRIAFQQVLDTYGALCTIELEQPIEDALADAVLALTPPRKPRKQPTADLFQIAQALASVCVMDFNANRARLFAEAKRLAGAAPTPTAGLIVKLYGQDGAWYTNDWRGQRGYTPRPPQVP